MINETEFVRGLEDILFFLNFKKNNTFHTNLTPKYLYRKMDLLYKILIYCCKNCKEQLHNITALS